MLFDFRYVVVGSSDVSVVLITVSHLRVLAFVLLPTSDESVNYKP